MADKLATPEQKQSPLYGVYTAEYPIHELSQRILSAQPDSSFEELLEFHRRRRVWHDGLSRSTKAIVGVLFGVGTLLLNTVPEPVLGQFGLDYDTFRVYVFWATVSVVLVFSTYFSFFWYWAFEGKQKAEFAATVFEYLKLLQNSTHNHGLQRTPAAGGLAGAAETGR